MYFYKTEPHSRTKLHFFVLILFVEFLAVKAVLLYFYFNNHFCIFLNFYELPIFFFIKYAWFQIIYYVFELLLFFCLYWKINNFLNLLRDEIIHSFDFSR